MAELLQLASERCRGSQRTFGSIGAFFLNRRHHRAIGDAMAPATVAQQIGMRVFFWIREPHEVSLTGLLLARDPAPGERVNGWISIQKMAERNPLQVPTADLRRESRNSPTTFARNCGGSRDTPWAITERLTRYE